MVLVVASEANPGLATASPSCAVPGGTVHAFDADTGRTICGLDGSDLETRPDLAWPPPGMSAVDACERCSTHG